MKILVGVLGLVAIGGLSTAAVAQQKADSLPAGVTAAMITDGEKVFKGAGLCSACHGADAKGVQGLGPSLVDQVWLHSKGSYDEIVKQVLSGVPAEKSKTGVVMPPKGGTQITDAQVRAVSAYVWRVSHPVKK